MTDPVAPPGPTRPEILDRLLANRQQFLSFLEARLDRASAEEVLQAAFVRALDRGDTVKDPETSVAWFYRLLRNALVDHYRRRGSEARALGQHAAEVSPPTEPELSSAVCTCMHRLLPELEPSHADILSRVDFEEAPLETVASNLGITRNNATVRLHRARQALKRALVRCCGTCASRGCLDCSCADPESRPAS